MFAQEDHPIAGGEGTGTPQEELTFEFPLFDNGLAQAEGRPHPCAVTAGCGLYYAQTELDVDEWQAPHDEYDWQ